ncbi:MAG: chemotaxis response regulator protein-glutamate methylesterase [Candidatus Sericytochromatia bacterium]
MIKILIADDSAFMRLSIDKMLSRENDFQVIGFCNDGEEVLSKVKELKPDVLTLDIEMPKLNGLQVLEKLMKENPLPVIMVSSLTKQGSEETLKALELGAVDVIAKPASFVSLKITDIFNELSEKIKYASKARIKRIETPSENSMRLRFLSERIKSRAEQIAKDINLKDYKPLIQVPNEEKNPEKKTISNVIERIDLKPEIILIGVSTGGPTSIQKILLDLPEDLPCSIIIAQHMPLGFTKTLANRLNTISKIEIKEAEEGDIIKPSRVLFAPSGMQTRVKKKFLGYYTSISKDEDKHYIYKPCIDVLFDSVAEVYKEKTLGIIMTGMGNDGTEGCKTIKKYGGKVFAQSEDSCVVSSMPNSVIKSNLVDQIFHLDSISKAIINLFKD